MHQTKKYLSLPMTICIYFGVLSSANIIALFSIQSIHPLIYTHEYRNYISNVFLSFNSLMYALSFLVPSIISTLYLLPIYKNINRGSCCIWYFSYLYNFPIISETPG